MVAGVSLHKTRLCCCKHIWHRRFCFVLRFAALTTIVTTCISIDICMYLLTCKICLLSQKALRNGVAGVQSPKRQRVKCKIVI